MTFDDWEQWEERPRPIIEFSMTARDIADAVLKQPPSTPERFAKLARLCETQTKLDAVVALLPDEMRAGIVDGMRGRVK